MSNVRIGPAILVALALAGCAGGSLGEVTSATPSATAGDMTGRWMLAAPNAPSCGLTFSGAPGAQQGNVAPDGGCPGRFYTSRRWVLEPNALVINDQNNNALARLGLAGGQFEGKAADGMPVTLSR